MLDGRELTEGELDKVKRLLDHMETIEGVSDEMRALIEQRWPHLLAKIRPAKSQ